MAKIEGFKFTEEESNIIKLHFGKKSLAQILKLLPRKINYKYFTQKCREDLGLKRDRAIPMPLKYPHNEDYWKDLNLVNTYLGGHLAADGCIMNYNKEQYTFSLMISDIDVSIIHNYKKELQYDKPIRFGKQNCSLRPGSPYNGFCRIDVHCFKKNAEHLNRHFNLKPNKTKLIGPTNLTNNYLNLAYLIGYMDGDGTITVCKSKKTGHKFLQFSCVSCSKKFLKWFKKIIDKTFPLTGPYSRYNKLLLKDKVSLWYFAVSGLRAAVIVDYLRKFPLENYRLARKWDNPEVLAYIAEKKAQYPEYFIEPDAAELAALMPQVAKPEEYQPQISLPLL